MARDRRALVLTLDARSSLLTSALVTVTVDTGVEPVDLRIDYRLTGADEPVRIPAPGA